MRRRFLHHWQFRCWFGGYPHLGCRQNFTRDAVTCWGTLSPLLQKLVNFNWPFFRNISNEPCFLIISSWNLNNYIRFLPSELLTFKLSWNFFKHWHRKVQVLQLLGSQNYWCPPYKKKHHWCLPRHAASDFHLQARRHFSGPVAHQAWTRSAGPRYVGSGADSH